LRTASNRVSCEVEVSRPVEVAEKPLHLVGRREVEDQIADSALGLGNRKVEIEDRAKVIWGDLRPFRGGKGFLGILCAYMD
jgi:hypothetical protein